MTLKQFFQLSGGIALGLIFFRTPFPFFIKYPLIFISVMGGILLAFIPIQGRPFSQWITAFFKAVYSPTEFFWSPTPVSTVPLAPKVEPAPKADLPPTPHDKMESQMFSKFSELFNSVTHHTTPPIAHTPSPIAPPKILEESITSSAPAPILQQTPPSSLVAPMSPPPPPPMTNKQFLEAVGLTPFAGHSSLSGGFASALAMGVFTPTQPNILAGMVTDGHNQILEGAILEIAEKASGLPVRALRSNKLGQFQIATPLTSGEYVITTDKEGYEFDPLVIVTSGVIIQPIEIKAKLVS